MGPLGFGADDRCGVSDRKALPWQAHDGSPSPFALPHAPAAGSGDPRVRSAGLGVSHDAVPDSGTDALSHDGSRGADALQWRVVVPGNLVWDDQRLWVGAHRAGGSSRRD